MQILSTRYNSGAFNLAMLILRIALGALIVHHGYQKILHMAQSENGMIDFLGLGKKISLYLVIFAEFFCGILLILGLLTRLACIPLIIFMLVAILKVLNSDVFGHAETATLYLAGFLAILFAGPGRISCDSLISKR